MDVLQYRDTGEFSDVTIVVESQEFKLHKFPLLIKSQFIKDNANQSHVSELTLDEFPGGAANFSQVADFCYGKKIDITLKNMVALYCAAEYLQMTGDGNLLILARRHVDDVLNMSRASRSLHSVVDLLVHACDAMIEDVLTSHSPHSILHEVFETILDIWQRASGRGQIINSSCTSFWSSTQATNLSFSEPGTVDKLLQIDLKVFAQLVRGNEKHDKVEDELSAEEGKGKAGDVTEKEQNNGEQSHEENGEEGAGNIHQVVAPAKVNLTPPPPSQRVRVLADLLYRYLKRVFQLKEIEAQQKRSKKERHEAEREIVKHAEEENKERHEEGDEKEDTHVPTKEDSEAGEEKTEELTRKHDEPYFADSSDGEGETNGKSHPKSKTEGSVTLKHSAADYLDDLILALPEDAPLNEVVDASWLQQALHLATKEGLSCRPRLLSLCGTNLDRLTNEELKQMPSSSLCEAITKTLEDKRVAPEVLICVLESHLKEMAKKGELSVEDFITVIKNIPESSRTSEEYNSMYEVLEELITSGVEVPDSQKEEILDIIDFSRCSEDNLQRALDKEIIPLKTLCQAAINKARRYKEEANNGSTFTKSDFKFTSEDNARYRSGLHSTSHKRPLQTTLAPLSSYNYSGSPPSSTFAEPVTSHFSGNLPTIPMDNYSALPTGGILDPYSTSANIRSSRGIDSTNYTKGFDESSIQAFEENLRGELNRISQSYDTYFKDRQRRNKNATSPSGSYGAFSAKNTRKPMAAATHNLYPSSAYGW